MTFETHGERRFAEYPTWNQPGFGYIYDLLPEYYPDNLAPDIFGVTLISNCEGNLVTKTCPCETAIQVGGYAHGFSFLSSAYDTSAKYYFYETVASGGLGGEVAAVGLTVPEPATMLLLGLGGLLLFRKRRA